MRPNLTVSSIAGALAVLGTSAALVVACGGDKPAVNANEVKTSDPVKAAGDGHCGADHKDHKGDAKCAAKDPTTAATTAASGAATTAATTAPTTAPTTPATTTAPAGSGSAKPTGTAPAKPAGGTPAKGAVKAGGQASCGAGTCSAKK